MVTPPCGNPAPSLPLSITSHLAPVVPPQWESSPVDRVSSAQQVCTAQMLREGTFFFFYFEATLLRYKCHSVQFIHFWIYSSIIFTKLAELWNHYHNPVLNIFITTRRSFICSYSYPLFPRLAPGNHWSTLYLYSFLFWTFHICGITQYVLLCLASFP